jgi:hypothetical protein
VIESTRTSNNEAPAEEFLLADTRAQAGGQPDCKAAVQGLAFFSRAMSARLDRGPLAGTGCWAQEPFVRVLDILIPRTAAVYTWRRLQSGCPSSQMDRSVRFSLAGRCYGALWPRSAQRRNRAEQRGYQAMGRIRTVLRDVPAKRLGSAMIHFLLFDIVPPRAHGRSTGILNNQKDVTHDKTQDNRWPLRIRRKTRN